MVAPTWTEGVETFLAQRAKSLGTTTAEVREGFFDGPARNSLLRRFAEPREIAAVAAFLLSQDAAVVNGTAQRADGGSYQAYP
jgi:NAD(P)-dependent dehydrogenase (short-subunit alcohol dehydrogenase family)